MKTSFRDHLKSFLVGSIILTASLCWGDTSLIRLYEWHLEDSLAPLILPVKSNETPEQAARRYINELSKKPDLMELFSGLLPQVEYSKFKLLSDKNLENRILMIANLPKDYGSKSLRVERVQRIVGNAEHKSYILPINANLGLTLSEYVDFKDQIATRFPMLIALGGDDVATETYHQEHTLAKMTAPTRDRFEIEIIKSYIQKEQGFILAFCRGSQIASVALGYKLIQDVPILVENSIPHANDWHQIRVLDTPHSLLKSLANTTGFMTVNSLHHQSVRYYPGGPLVLAAVSSDGVTEATELRNGLGLLTQFHPELMDNDLGSKIIYRAIQQKNKVLPVRCQRVF